MHLKAVLFDFDGTLTAPGHIDFDGIRERIGVPAGTPILEFIAAVKDPVAKKRAKDILEESEAASAAASMPNKGAEELVRYLRSASLKLGIITRNSMNSLRLSFANFKKMKMSDFDVVLTREHVANQKPHPECVLKASRLLGVPAGEMVVVGDYVFDIEAGRKAGAMTVYLDNRRKAGAQDVPADYVISELLELKGIIFKNDMEQGI